MQGSISENIKMLLILLSESSISENIRKAFFWENIRIFFILEQENSISGNIRNFFCTEFFFCGGEAWAYKVNQVAVKTTANSACTLIGSIERNQSKVVIALP